MFGPDARVNIRGSFHVSTADAMQFSDGTTFSSHLGMDGDFTVAQPLAGFLSEQPAAIFSQGSRIGEATSQRQLSFIGGDILVGDGAQIGVFDGLLQITSLATRGAVRINSLAEPSEVVGQGVQLGTITIVSERTVLDVSGDHGGAIHLKAHAITLSDGAVIQNGILLDGQSGDIVVRANTLNLSTGAGISTIAGRRASGSAGDIDIHAQTVVIRDGGIISSETMGDAHAGGVTLTTETMLLDGFSAQDPNQISRLASVSGDIASGNAGRVRVDSHRVTITNGAQQSGTPGGMGAILITARDHVIVDGFGANSTSLVSASSQEGSMGNAGNVAISAQTVSVTRGAQISSATSAPGRACPHRQ